MIVLRRYNKFALIFPWIIVFTMSICVSIIPFLFFQYPVYMGVLLGIAIFLALFYFAEPSPSVILLCPQKKTIHTQVFTGMPPTPVDVSEFRYVHTKLTCGSGKTGFSADLELWTEKHDKCYVVTRYNSVKQTFFPVKDLYEPDECKQARQLLIQHLGVSDMDKHI